MYHNRNTSGEFLSQQTGSVIAHKFAKMDNWSHQTK